MPHTWLIRFKLSAAIALPSVSLLWLSPPAKAVEDIRQPAWESESFAQTKGEVSQLSYSSAVLTSHSVETADFEVVSSQKVATTDRAHSSESIQQFPTSQTETLTPTQTSEAPADEASENLPKVTAIPSQVESPNTNTWFSLNEPVATTNNADEMLTEPLDLSVAPAKDALSPPHAPISQAAEASVESPQKLSPSAIKPASTEVSHPGRMSPQFGVLFSQAASPDLTESPEEDLTESPEEDETFSPLPEAEPTDDTAPLPETDPIDDTAPLPTFEESAPTLEELEEGAEETIDDTDEEDASEEPSLEDSTPTLEELEEDLEEPTDIDEDSGAEPFNQEEPIPEEVIPTPAEIISEPLQILDPYPNPVIIQTQPEEVEIIGTQPITLEEATELAYRNNPDLRVAQLELEQSQAALREALAARLPTVSVNGALQAQNTASTSFSPTGMLETDETIGAFGSAQISTTYSLFTSGGRSAAIQAAQEQIRFTELEVERRREELRINTTNEYYDLQEAIESIRINRAFLEEAERNLRDTILREEVGVGTRFDVLQAEVQAANARQDLVNAQANRQVAERVLAARLNVPPSLTITTVPVAVAGDWSLSLEESIVLAYQNRAELEQQLTQREISEQLRRQELSVLGPQIDLVASYQLSDTFTTSDSFSDDYQFGVQVSWTLFDGGAARAAARQQELEAQIADRNFEEIRNTIRADVESAFFTLQSNFTNIDTARLAVEQAQEALDLAVLRFDAGVGTQLEILNAQSELTDAEVNLVQAVVGYNRSLASLDRAVSNVVLEDE